MTNLPNDLEAHWMPFSHNKRFKKAPRLLSRADGVYYYTPDGRQLLDSSAGLWCVNAGHGNEHVKKAIKKQIDTLDFVAGFNFGHPASFELANRLVALMPDTINHVFFTNSGSESVDTALKIALAYHRHSGEGHRRVLIGRERGYHGVGFGGMSVGGVPPVRQKFGITLPFVAHLRHTLDLDRNRFSRGQPEHGAELADDLERLCQLHGAENIAAVIVEPVAGSTGVLPPPKGYLERLHALCAKHGILLIFDEVITGFGRLGENFAVQYFGIEPDIITCAKGITNGTIPMGGVFVSDKIFNRFMEQPDHVIDFAHGYTYSAHPMACAAALGTLDAYEETAMLTRGRTLAPLIEEGVHALKDLPLVKDIRNIGVVAAIELESDPQEIGRRGYDAMVAGFFKHDLYIRVTADIIALSPSLTIQNTQIDELFDKARKTIQSIT